MKPIVTIVGRPNVGKSTLFNRITRTRDAIVDNLPGVTRDRKIRDTVWNDIPFKLIDTGGFIQGDDDVFAADIRFQIERAMIDADLVIMVLDGKSGVSPFDMDIVKLLRFSSKMVLCIVNKIDSQEQEELLSDFYVLGGLGQFYPVSAEHGYGISDFLDELVRKLPRHFTSGSQEETIRVAVVGKPNAGKSSLINSIIGEKRLVVNKLPGTTRDTIDSKIIIKGKSYLMIDTAGIRRKRNVSERLEKFSIIKTLQCLDSCDIALILIDAKQGISEQDIRIAGYAYSRGCGAIFLINKWDLIDNSNGKALKQYLVQLRENAKFLNFAPAISISALTGLRVNRIFKLVDEVYAQYSVRISTGRLNRIVQGSISAKEPSLYRGSRLKFYYTTQITTKPPTIISFVNYPNVVHFSYKRYLLNRIREATGLVNTPLRLFFRQRSSGDPVFLNKKRNVEKKKRRYRSKKLR